MGNMGNREKVKIQLERDVAEELIKLKQFGDTYSDVVRRLLEK